MDVNQSCIRILADTEQIKECRNKLNANAIAFEQLSGLLALAGNEVRLKIMFLLEEENELCPCGYFRDEYTCCLTTSSQNERRQCNRIKACRSDHFLFPEIGTTQSAPSLF